MNPIQRACTTIVVIMGLVQVGFAEGDAIAPPRPYGAVPSERQLKWHQLEFYGFLHFTVNTFTDKEWGYGDEHPKLFHPTDFSAEQIVSTAKMAGMTGLILTCKHHDGFCLWPSRYTEHSVKRSPWQDGKGDVVRDISAACRRHGLKFGVYLSPWDRNHADYGKPAYVDYYRKQLRELLTQYGPIFEVWWDGANGGTGYYGGARENRRIDRGTYYGWEETTALVRELQGDACIFSDAGPDVRWNGNERGIAGDPCWATYTPTAAEGASKPGPGTTNYREANQGHRNGKYWLPAESDVSIRPGWFYHPDQDEKVRSPKNLVDLYYVSVGRGSSLLLNLPPDRRGRIHASDVKSLRQFRKILDATFDHNLAVDATLTASNVRGATDQFGTSRLIDGDRQTYWATDDDVTAPELIVTLPEPVTFHVVDLREYLPLGQRVSTWALDRWSDGAWVEFAKGESIGNRRLWRGGPITTDRVRLRLTGPVCPAISELGLYAEPRHSSTASAPDYDIDLSTISSGYDGKTCWVHPRLGTIPGERPAVVLTMQKLLLTGSDVFFALNEMRTDNVGRTWSGPVEHASLGRRQEGDGLVAAICDFTPMARQDRKTLGDRPRCPLPRQPSRERLCPADGVFGLR